MRLFSNRPTSKVAFLLLNLFLFAAGNRRYRNSQQYLQQPQPQQPQLRSNTISSLISTIKATSPKSSSISPSWNGKSPYNVIGSGQLPLQNEANANDQFQSREFQTQSAAYSDNRKISTSESKGYNSRPASRYEGEGDYNSYKNAGGRSSFKESFRPKQQKQSPYPMPEARRRPMEDYRRPQEQPPQRSRRPYDEQPMRGRPNDGPRRQFNSPGGRRSSPSQGRRPFERPYDGRPKMSDGGGEYTRRPGPNRPMDAMPRKEQQDYRRRPPPPPAPQKVNKAKDAMMETEKPYQVIPVPEGGGPGKDQFRQLGANPFRHEENKDFPVQNFEGPVRVKPKFDRPKRRPITHPPPPSSRRPPPPPPMDGLDLNVNLTPENGFESEEMDPRKRPGSDLGSFEDYLDYEGGGEMLDRLEFDDFDMMEKDKKNKKKLMFEEDMSEKHKAYPKNDDFDYDAFYPTSSEEISLKDDDDKPAYKLFGADETPLNAGPSVDFDYKPERPPPHRPQHHKPIRKAPRRPPPPPIGNNRFRNSGRPTPDPYGPPRRYTTPRPIPTPGPEDFPEPPPRRAPPPPTHPTHPPPITHPPEHFRIPHGVVGNPSEFLSEDYFDGSSEAPPREHQRPPFRGIGNSDESRERYEKPKEIRDRRPFRESIEPFANKPPRRNPFRDEERDSFRMKENMDKLIRDAYRPSPPKKEVIEEPPRFPTYSAPTYDLEQNYRNPSERKDPFVPPSSYESRPSIADEEEFNSEGFFSIPQSFPNLASLGANFESMKINRRKKRSAAGEGPYAHESRYAPRRRRQEQGGYQSLRKSRTKNPQRRQGEFGFQPGFWEDVETEFFSHGGPPFGQRQKPYTRRGTGSSGGSGGSGSSRERDVGYSSRPRQSPTPTYYGHHTSKPGSRHRDPYPQQTVQTYPVNDYSRNNYVGYDEKENEILGSGDFTVLKGGTFYDPETYYNTRYNSRPSQGYRGGDFFENFRDFADIKGDLYRYNQY